ncbi:hypothetical protein Geob_2223 [Geotalea daltonii FRC-32]|uniref:Uncharacterized protein n=2 Tax=Geotalea TaxID=2910589 RepID=B9M9K5_GEODF|nr:hypothetical protein Geob_2223 [Geotalea daltonii FRC-32]
MDNAALQILKGEAQSLITRIDRMEPFALRMPMVLAAAVPLPAQVAIERHLSGKRLKMRAMMTGYLKWLESPEGRAASPSLAQRRFSFLRLRFIAILAQLDIFAIVFNQRSEHDTGIWLSGLDVFAADALTLPGKYYQAPPVICFLERSPGAAIRRARTRLPGGDDNPVAVIQIPRERMIGGGIASSLVHEVGHQGAALLDLVTSLRIELQKRKRNAGNDQIAWRCWDRWTSEIVADLWAVARLGVSATVGLMTVVGLPKPFMFRVDFEDPHPAPWIRVMLSCAMGQELYPHSQWQALAKNWEAFYPCEGLEAGRLRLFALLQKTMPEFVKWLVHYRPKALRGKTLQDALSNTDLQPARLGAIYKSWKEMPQLIKTASPTLVFAVIGQAKMNGLITAEEESRVLADMLRYWALKITLDTTAVCAGMSRAHQPLTV